MYSVAFCISENVLMRCFRWYFTRTGLIYYNTKLRILFLWSVTIRGKAIPFLLILMLLYSEI